MDADIDRSIALVREVIEQLLVLVRRQSVPGLPGRSATLVPDRGVEGFAVYGIGTDIDRSIALVREVVDELLVLVRGQSVPGLPCGSATQLPDRAIGSVWHSKPTQRIIDSVPDDLLEIAILDKTASEENRTSSENEASTWVV